MVEHSCCTESSFLNMKNMWNEGAYPFILLNRTYLNIFKFISDKLVNVGMVKKPAYVTVCKRSKEDLENC